MKLYLKDQFSFILVFILTVLGLPFLIHYLDNFEEHVIYYLFLATILLVTSLTVRFFRRKQLYENLEEKKSLEATQIRKSHASIEQAYEEQLKSFKQDIFLTDIATKKHLDTQEMLISNAVHQLKTPLASIRLLVENNQDKYEELEDTWEKLLSESNKLDHSLNQVLLYTRSANLLADIKIEEVNLEKLVTEVINELRTYFLQLSVFPKLSIDDKSMTTIYSDYKWLKTVIYQLLTNAIKYSEKNSTVYIRLSQHELIIENQGPTIPQSDIKRVFNLFYTGNIGRESGEATGIGLYLVKEILTSLNHPFYLTSENQMTQFTISFKTTS